MSMWERLVYAIGAAMLATLHVLIIGASVLGFSFSEWTRLQAAIVGILATIAGIAAAHVLLFGTGIKHRRLRG